MQTVRCWMYYCQKQPGLKQLNPVIPVVLSLNIPTLSLKEMGNDSPARIAAHAHRQPATDQPPLAALQQLKTQYSASLYEGPESALIRWAMETFKHQTNEYLSLLPPPEGSIRNPTNRDALSERKKAIHLYSSTLTSLIRKVKPDDSTLTILQKIAARNQTDKTFSYAINKSYRPLEMIMHRKGDCVSFCHLIKCWRKLVDAMKSPLLI